MDNETIQIAAGFRLGAPVDRPHVCVCGATVPVDGHHGLSCRHGSGRHCRHNQLNDLLCHALKVKVNFEIYIADRKATTYI